MNVELAEAQSTLFYRIFKFFASLRLAIFVLVSLMIVLAVGTFLESYEGTEAARILIYDAPWFSLLLFVLGMNVAFAAIDRYPWEKKHIGFVVTHLGIILILTGSFITHRFMIDGGMAIEEGRTEHRITLSEPLIYLFSEQAQQDWLIPVKKRAFPWTGQQKILSIAPFDVFLTTYYPKARMQESIKPAPSPFPSPLPPKIGRIRPPADGGEGRVRGVQGPAALKVALHNSFVNQTQWLVQNDPESGEGVMGPVTLRFTDELLKKGAVQIPETSAGYLEFKFERRGSVPSTVQIPVDSKWKLPKRLALEGTPYEVEITRILKNALVAGKELVDQESKGGVANPAAELTLRGEGLEERHTVFAKFPDFPTQHGLRPSAAGVRIFYRMPDSGSRGGHHEIRFVYSRKPKEVGAGLKPAPTLIVQVIKGLETKTLQPKLGEEIQTGWMGDLQFRIDEFYPAVTRERKFTPEPNSSAAQDVLPVISLQFRKGNESQTVWLQQGISETIDLEGVKHEILYGEKRIPAGFRLRLRDFRVQNYPGTNRPASFESDVTLIDDAKGMVRDQTISMNKPLIHKGFRVYQSGYTLEPGQPEMSIFSVGRDPGVPVKYLGAIVMIGGIITMYYTRRFSTNSGSITT